MRNTLLTLGILCGLLITGCGAKKSNGRDWMRGALPSELANFLDTTSVRSATAFRQQITADQQTSLVGGGNSITGIGTISSRGNENGAWNSVNVFDGGQVIHRYAADNQTSEMEYYYLGNVRPQAMSTIRRLVKAVHPDVEANFSRINEGTNIGCPSVFAGYTSMHLWYQTQGFSFLDFSQNGNSCNLTMVSTRPEASTLESFLNYLYNYANQN